MFFKAGDDDTICALSTAPGMGGIAVIRVSGSSSVDVVRKLCRFLPKDPESHRVCYGICRDIDSGEPLDEVLVTYFAAGRSFTGEATVEIACHGGPAVVSSILKQLVSSGARTAARGEFTYRAFMNGRIDLVQAESVLGMIESQSKQAAKVALRQLQGHLSHDFSKIEDGVVWLLANLEASIDFAAEGIELVSKGKLLERTEGLLVNVGQLVDSYSKGRLLREGVEIALVGRPNAGKSSLLNALLGEERAIVTPHAGTTRDTIEGRISVSGVTVTFVDTAGLRETDNEIEKIGIERSRSAMGRADVIFHVIDPTLPDAYSEMTNLSPAEQQNRYLILNKSDIDRDGQSSEKIKVGAVELGFREDRVLSVSAATGQGLGLITQLLERLVPELDANSSSVITQARHLELLQKIHSCLGAAHRLISNDSSPEFIAFELQDAVRGIHELLGKRFDEQVIDRIFREFCLGK